MQIAKTAVSVCAPDEGVRSKPWNCTVDRSSFADQSRLFGPLLVYKKWLWSKSVATRAKVEGNRVFKSQNAQHIRVET